MIETLQLNAEEENYKYLKTIMPIYESGTHKGKINWKKSIGIIVPYFICVGKGECKQEYKGELIIRDYKESKLYFEGIEKGIDYGNFVKGGIAGILNVEYRIPDPDNVAKVGDVIKDKKRNLTIVDKKHISKGEITPNGNVAKTTKWWYKLRCNKDGYEHWKVACHLKTDGCPCCSNKIAVLGINTIWDTRRYLVTEFGLDEKFAKTHTWGTNKKGKFTCPNCGKVIFKRILDVVKIKSIACACGDGISYPEKLGYSIFSQLSIEFERQYSPNYLKRKMSDFYFPDFKLVVELDGILGHEGGKVHGNSKKTLEEYIKVDNWKTEQHEKHGVKTIRINCFESNLKYIKNNILESELVNYFDFSNVDWIKAEEFALKNIVKKVCDCYNEHEGITTKGLLEFFPQIKNIGTIANYLKKGTELGWCHYYPKEERKLNGIRSGDRNKKCYIVIFPDGTIYKSEFRKTMVDYLGVSDKFISHHSDGKPYNPKSRYKIKRLLGIRLFTKELFIKEFGEEEYNKL